MSHEGKNDLVVEYNGLNDPTAEEWRAIIDGFTKQIVENTRHSTDSTLIADFSTTGAVEAQRQAE